MASAEKASKYLSLVQDEFRKHSDGSVCKAQSPETCPFNRRAESGDRLEGNAGSGNTVADDAAYLDAVKRGDMATCAKMVREAAARAMPDTKIVDSNGNPAVCSHITDGKFNEFSMDRYGAHGTHGAPGVNFLRGYGETNPYYGHYGSRAVNAFLDIRKPVVVDDEGKSKRTISREQIAAFVRQFALYGADESSITGCVDAIDKGVLLVDGKGSTVGGAKQADDGQVINALYRSQQIRWNGSQSHVFYDSLRHTTGIDGIVNNRGLAIVFLPEQIKSADPITYDDAGNVIPLSKRFNFSSADIRDEATGRILDIIRNVDAEDASLEWTSGRNPEIQRYRGRRQPIDRVPKKITKQIIVENCKLIKTVDEDMLPLLAGKVYGMLTGKVEADEFIDWCVDECNLEEWQAYRIARDQIVKAREWIKIADWKHRGVSYVMWCHSGKDAEPRDYHIAKWNGKSGLRNGRPNGLNGFVFNIDNPPVIDKKTGERGLPSTLIGCKCFLRGIKGV